MGSRSRRQARSAAGKHNKTPYKKQFLTIDEQIDRLQSRDYAEAKDAADNAARCLTELARLLSPTSPLFPNMRQLRSIIHSVQQNLARQQPPQDLEKGLDLIATIEKRLSSGE